jgi:hypothetical protein
MSMKQAKLIIDGNTRQQDRVVHELQKLVSEANQQPELDVSMQTEHVDQDEPLEVETAFDGGKAYE